jgi:hypothetical protein
MVLRFDDDVYFSDVNGGRLLATQAAKARTSIQIASMDGTNTRWTELIEPCLLIVSRSKTIRVSGKELDELILACEQDTEYAVGNNQRL